MRDIEIEIWVNRILDSMEQTGLTEDHRVEFKSTWIEGNNAARHIAALANSAPDDTVLLLIGVDDKAKTVVGVGPREMADWWPQVEEQFADRVTPEPTHLNMRHHNVPFVAIAFKTDRAPYLVRNEAYGSLKGQNMAWEVPYRVGNQVRTATRNQLLSLLAPTLHLPKVEMISAGVALYKAERKDEWVQRCVADALFYLVMPGDETVTLDARACEVTFEVGGRKLSPGGEPRLSRLGTHPMPPTNQTCVATGAAVIGIHIDGDIPSLGNYIGPARLTVSLRPIGAKRKISFTCDLESRPSNPISGVTHSFTAQGLLPR